MQGWPRDAAVETYKWGRLTAGAAARALWLLMLPFQLANVAMWQRLAAGGRSTGGFRALCRLFALSLTAAFLVNVVGISLDLVAWQCTVPDTRCTADRAWLAPFVDGPLATPGRRLAVLALVPVTAIVIVWQLARRAWRDYDSYPVPEVQAAGEGLAHPLFWRNRTIVGRLRAVHLAAAFATLDLFVVGTLVPHDRSATGFGLTAACVGVVLACVVAVCLPAVFDKNPDSRWPDRLVVVLRAAALALTAVTLWYAFTLDLRWDIGASLPGYDKAVVWLFVGQLVLLVVLAGTIAVQRSGSGAFNAVLFAAVALGTAAAFTGAMLYRVADFLSRAPELGATGTLTEGRRVEPATAYQWVGVGFMVLLVLAALGPFALAYQRRTIAAGARAKTDELFPGKRGLGPRRAAEVDQAIASARLTDRVVSLLGWGCLPLGLAALVGAALALAGIRPADVTSDPLWQRVLEETTDLGTYLIGVAALGLAVLGLLAYRYDGVRRVIGVIWDLGTFWPRTCHPLSPPCYAERIVPELMVRLIQLTAPEANLAGVVLVGHGQGSVLAAATVLQLPAPVRERLALLTVGSPLRRLYARLFPAYVNDNVLADLAARLTAPGGRPRWINLWRATDPIGGPVAGERTGDVLSDVDRELHDPTGFDFSPELGHYPPIRGHIGVEEDPAFAAAVVELARRVESAQLSAKPERIPAQRQTPQEDQEIIT